LEGVHTKPWLKWGETAAESPSALGVSMIFEVPLGSFTTAVEFLPLVVSVSLGATPEILITCGKMTCAGYDKSTTEDVLPCSTSAGRAMNKMLVTVSAAEPMRMGARRARLMRWEGAANVPYILNYNGWQAPGWLAAARRRALLYF
jgi:hypothetical protein